MTLPKVGLLHPGTQHSFQTALALQQGDALAWYATSVFYDPDKWPYRGERYLPRGLADKANRMFRRRYEPQLDRRLVRQCGWGWLVAATARHLPPGAAGAMNRSANRDFGKSVIRLLEREPVDIVWAYDTAALEVFRWAKRRGIVCVLDRTIAHSAAANAIMSEEHERHPEFFAEPFAPKPKRQLDDEQEEIDLADAVLAGSRFCAETLLANRCAAEKLRIINYGYDERVFPTTPPLRHATRHRPIEFLFAGTVCARKGVAYLLKAFADISPTDAVLTLLGSQEIPPSTFARFADRVRHVPQVSRSDIVRYFTQADCFIFPSLFEGGPFVLREIYGAGLGAVQTRSAGEGIVDGRNGIVLEMASVSGIIKAVERIVADPDCLPRWQSESWAARELCTWSVYRQGVRSFLDGLVGRSDGVAAPLRTTAGARREAPAPVEAGLGQSAGATLPSATAYCRSVSPAPPRRRDGAPP